MSGRLSRNNTYPGASFMEIEPDTFSASKAEAKAMS